MPVISSKAAVKCLRTRLMGHKLWSTEFTVFHSLVVSCGHFPFAGRGVWSAKFVEFQPIIISCNLSETVSLVSFSLHPTDETK